MYGTSESIAKMHLAIISCKSRATFIVFGELFFASRELRGGTRYITANMRFLH